MMNEIGKSGIHILIKIIEYVPNYVSSKTTIREFAGIT